MASGGTRIKCGSFYGTGASLDIEKVGFRPRSVWLINVTDVATLKWNEAMPDDSGYQEDAGIAGTWLTSGGITPLDDGFTIGVDGDVNVEDELIYYEAHE